MIDRTTTKAQVLEHAAELMEDMADALERSRTSGSGFWPVSPDLADRRAQAAIADMRDTGRLLRDYARLAKEASMLLEKIHT